PVGDRARHRGGGRGAADAAAHAPARAYRADRGGDGGDVMRLSVNGHGYDVHAEVGATLAEALREELSLTGTKIACAEGHCGACTVLVDGEPVLSCITLVHTLDGAEVTTIEGLRDHPMVDAFVRSDALQCGFCTPVRARSSADPRRASTAASARLARPSTPPIW